MIHFALISYSPNTAAMNRLRGYWNVMESKGIDVCVTFLHQDNMSVQIEGEFKHLKFKYCNGHSKHSKLIGLCAFWLHLLQFVSSLKMGDVVYTYSINKVTRLLAKSKGAKVVAEITEHPSIIDGGQTISIPEAEKYEVAKSLKSLVVISESLKKDFITHGICEEQINVVNMIVDSSRFQGLTKNGSGFRYITYCGTASNNKDGVDELIKAFFIVTKRVDDVKLRIIGKTPSVNDESGNLQMIRSFGIEDRIEFTGQVDYDRVPQMLMDSDVLALDRPDSIQAQCGFPTKLGEYLLTGNPVVVTRVGDIPLFLEDGRSALLANERNSEEFAGKLLWVLENQSEAAAIGQKGKEVALKYFNAEIETEKLINILQNA